MDWKMETVRWKMEAMVGDVGAVDAGWKFCMCLRHAEEQCNVAGRVERMGKSLKYDGGLVLSVLIK